MMGEGTKNRTSAARQVRRAALVKLLASDEGAVLGRKELAARIGVKPDTMKDYYDDALWEEVAALKEARARDPLAAVDEAMLEAARAGHVGAARLVYMRLAGKVVADETEDVEALVKEIDDLRAKLVGK